jgi:hypothetical protein
LEKAVRTPKIDDRCEIQVDTEVSAGGSRRFAERANSAATGIARLAGGREVTPKSGKPVDDTSLEVDREKWSWFQILKVCDQISSLLR